MKPIKQNVVNGYSMLGMGYLIWNLLPGWERYISILFTVLAIRILLSEE